MIFKWAGCSARWLCSMPVLVMHRGVCALNVISQVCPSSESNRVLEIVASVLLQMSWSWSHYFQFQTWNWLPTFIINLMLIFKLETMYRTVQPGKCQSDCVYASNVNAIHEPSSCLTWRFSKFLIKIWLINSNFANQFSSFMDNLVNTDVFFKSTECFTTTNYPTSTQIQT